MGMDWARRQAVPERSHAAPFWRPVQDRLAGPYSDRPLAGRFCIVDDTDAYSPSLWVALCGWRPGDRVQPVSWVPSSRCVREKPGGFSIGIVKGDSCLLTLAAGTEGEVELSTVGGNPGSPRLVFWESLI
jgi:hypothetical protein